MSMDLSQHLKSPAVFRLAAAVLFCVIAGSLGSVVTITGPGSWYEGLLKPTFQPPNWIFAPVWTTLFIMMGIALYLVWNEGLQNPNVKPALAVFGLQFILNILWSFLFFGMQSPFLGLAGIIILWFLILATIALFFRVKRSAAFLLVPYILWVSFAMFLNYTIWALNP